MPPLLLIAGPTASGKSAFAISLARLIGGEIVGADARQIYSGLGILSATPTMAEREGIPHHLVGLLPRGEPLSAADYARLAEPVIEDITARGRRVIVVGGTGLYIKTLTHGLADAPPPRPEFRAALADIPLDKLVEQLKTESPLWAVQIDLSNRRRIERALERVAAGETTSPPKTWDTGPIRPFMGFLLTPARDVLHGRIERRVYQMFDQGAVDEVRCAMNSPVDPPPIGFAEIRDHLDGRISNNECRARIAALTRQYAKRQLTWFRRQTDFLTLDPTAPENSPENIAQSIIP